MPERIRVPYLVGLGVAVIALAAVLATRGIDWFRPGREPPRTMERLLPWHKPRLDSKGNLLPWADRDPGRAYEKVIRLGWHRLERMRRAAGSAPPTYMLWATFDPRTGSGGYFQYTASFVIGSFAESAERWYEFSGDAAPVRLTREILDHDLRHGITPRSWAWAGVPFTTSCGGSRTYGGCSVDAPSKPVIEPDKVGEAGMGFLRFWELTRDPAYRRIAVQAGTQLARHVRRGDAGHTPWPYRVDARTGRTVDRAEYGGGFAPTLTFFDGLLRRKLGPASELRRARRLLLEWLLHNPLNPQSPAFDKWSRYAEDIPAWPRNVTQVSATFVADYLLHHRAAVDPNWRQHAAHLVSWTRKTFEKGPFHGAVAIDEQAQGRTCCSAAGLVNHTARWAALAIELAALDGDRGLAAQGERSLSYATYFSDSRGNVSCCGVDHREYWFNTGYGDFGRYYLEAMAADPRLAPRGERHLLSSTSAIRRIAYRPRSIAYRAFDPRGVETLRVDRRPVKVAGGSWSTRALAGGDAVLTIRRRRPAVRIDFRERAS